jgi:hypothetical protein
MMLSAVCTTGTEAEIEAYARSVADGYRPPIHDHWPQPVKDLIRVGGSGWGCWESAVWFVCRRGCVHFLCVAGRGLTPRELGLGQPGWLPGVQPAYLPPGAQRRTRGEEPLLAAVWQF